MGTDFEVKWAQIEKKRKTNPCLVNHSIQLFVLRLLSFLVHLSGDPIHGIHSGAVPGYHLQIIILPVYL